MKWKYRVAGNGNTHVEYKELKIGHSTKVTSNYSCKVFLKYFQYKVSYKGHAKIRVPQNWTSVHYMSKYT